MGDLGQLVIGGIYRHFKGRDLPLDNLDYSYKLVAVGKHTEIGEEVVIYQQLYSKDEYLKGTTWVRPLNGPKGFLTPERINSLEVPRFKLLMPPVNVA